jgi:ABC-type transport system involved in multi-copper enzyme maturation, permease component
LSSHNFGQLLAKEIRELIASRAFWLMLLIVGLLVGHSFITAVNTYAEMSGIGGAPAALPQALNSLDGILSPTWGAYDLVATFLFPFVAIRLIAAEKESGALKLLLQLPGTVRSKLTAKGLALLLAWMIAWLPGLIAILLWRSYGGHIDSTETLNLLLGHLLRGMLSAAIAVAAAGLAENASSAAIVTLSFTVGTWALDFVAAGRGGFLQQLASFTPTAALRSFEQGLLRLSTVAVMLALIIGGFALAAIWLHTGRSIQSRLVTTLVFLGVLTIFCVGSSRVLNSWDMSANRRNSFPAADDATLRQVNERLKLTVFLAPEDPRLSDLEQGVLKKLRRVMGRKLEVDYVSGTQSGLFAQSEDQYGEIWYEMDGRKIVDRSTIEEVVLDQIYQLSAIKSPERSSEDGFPGYPLAVQPKRAALIFYFVWPLAVVIAWWRIRR